jgi:hypothetical protein
LALLKSIQERTPLLEGTPLEGTPLEGTLLESTLLGKIFGCHFKLWQYIKCCRLLIRTAIDSRMINASDREIAEKDEHQSPDRPALCMSTAKRPEILSLKHDLRRPAWISGAKLYRPIKLQSANAVATEIVFGMKFEIEIVAWPLIHLIV